MKCGIIKIVNYIDSNELICYICCYITKHYLSIFMTSILVHLQCLTFPLGPSCMGGPEVLGLQRLYISQ